MKLKVEIATQDGNKKLVIGRINGLLGIKGWVKIFSHTSPRDNIFSYKPWWLECQGEYAPVEVEATQISGKGVAVKFKGLDDRDEAAKLLGQDIVINQSQLQSLSAGEYYWSQLIGLEVITRQGELLGIIKSWLETGANDVLVVSGDRERLIPYLPGTTIQSVDLEQGCVRVDWHVDD